MGWLIDTNIAIHLRDRDASIVARIEQLQTTPFLSVISRVELEGGIYARPDLSARRRAALDIFLESMIVLDFSEAIAARYRAILAVTGFSRPRILDRMIAATALHHNLTVITFNGTDFRDIPNLNLEAW